MRFGSTTFFVYYCWSFFVDLWGVSLTFLDILIVSLSNCHGLGVHILTTSLLINLVLSEVRSAYAGVVKFLLCLDGRVNLGIALCRLSGALWGQDLRGC